MSREANQEVVRAKVILVGAPGVGKTSLVRQFVHSIFSDEYLSTLGVKVDRKLVVVDRAAVSMVVWDMHGETEGLQVPANYLRGASAALGVFDLTRPDTAATAASLLGRVGDASPRAITCVVGNKRDLVSVPEADAALASFPDVSEMHATSAKTGAGVEGAFQDVAQRLVDRLSPPT